MKTPRTKRAVAWMQKRIRALNDQRRLAQIYTREETKLVPIGTTIADARNGIAKPVSEE